MTPEERMRELVDNPYVRDMKTRASLEFHRCAHENAAKWWALEKQAYVVHPTNPSEEELLIALQHPAATMVATLGEMAAAAHANTIIVALVNVASFSIQGPELEAFIEECIRAHTEKACKLLRPASDDENSRSRVSHIIDLYTTTALTSIRMISHAQAALKNGMDWEEVAQRLPGPPGPSDDVLGDVSVQSGETAEERSSRRRRIVEPWLRDANITSPEMWATSAGGGMDKNTPRDYLNGKTKTLRADSRTALARPLRKSEDELPS